MGLVARAEHVVISPGRERGDILVGCLRPSERAVVNYSLAALHALGEVPASQFGRVWTQWNCSRARILTRPTVVKRRECKVHLQKSMTSRYHKDCEFLKKLLLTHLSQKVV